MTAAHPSAELPFTVRSDLLIDAPWARLSPSLRRSAITTPTVEGAGLGISEHVGSAHAARSSLLFRVGGGHLRAPREDVLSDLAAGAMERMSVPSAGPAAHIASVIHWLEEEQRSGTLERSYTTASLTVLVSDAEVWTWHTGPHGVVLASRGLAHFTSTDLRIPVLRTLGLVPERGYRSPEIEIMEKASSIFCIGTPHGYERMRTQIAGGDLAIALERGALPFGPWPAEPLSMRELWSMDAGWKHGLTGLGVAVGHAGAGDLCLPSGWKTREILLGNSLEASGSEDA